MVMDDHQIPPPTSPTLVRSSEISRLQGQLLAQAYLRIVPEIRRSLDGGKDQMASVNTTHNDSMAARAAAGA
jgi:hypothetical protein